MELIREEYALVFIAVGVDLDSEPGLLIHLPVAHILDRGAPLLSLNRPILVLLLVLHPVDRAVGAVLLGPSVISIGLNR